MTSKIDKIMPSDDGNDKMALYWFKEDKWEPRFTFNHEDSLLPTGPSVGDFSPNLQLVLTEASIFSQKLIVCKLELGRKLTLAGNRLKITGPPRFSTDAQPTFRFLDSSEEAREILRDIFDIPMDSTDGLNLKKSLAAHPDTWSHA